MKPSKIRSAGLEIYRRLQLNFQTRARRALRL